jgi:5-formyltetrahydrofolate cyclo-ligase
MEAKRLLRSRLMAARAARPTAQITAAGVALADHAARAWSAVGTVAAYAATGTEPPTRPALDRLSGLGVTVLLPVIVDGGLRWAPYDGWERLVPGPLGLLRPTGGLLPAEVLRDVDVVAAPALAVDRDGHRLGRGGGYFDRALADVPPSMVVAVVFDDEVLVEVPVEPHDREVGAALTPSGLHSLPAASPQWRVCRGDGDGVGRGDGER